MGKDSRTKKVGKDSRKKKVGKDSRKKKVGKDSRKKKVGKDSRKKKVGKDSRKKKVGKDIRKKKVGKDPRTRSTSAGAQWGGVFAIPLAMMHKGEEPTWLQKMWCTGCLNGLCVAVMFGGWTLQHPDFQGQRSLGPFFRLAQARLTSEVVHGGEVGGKWSEFMLVLMCQEVPSCLHYEIAGSLQLIMV